MSKNQKLRAFAAATIVGGCVCAAAVITTNRDNHPNATKNAPAPAMNLTVGASSKISDDDLAVRYRRRVVRRRTVVVV
jgi:hypothetical protein